MGRVAALPGVVSRVEIRDLELQERGPIVAVAGHRRVVHLEDPQRRPVVDPHGHGVVRHEEAEGRLEVLVELDRGRIERACSWSPAAAGGVGMIGPCHRKPWMRDGCPIVAGLLSMERLEDDE
jgi:hypothetical protein